MEPSKRPPLRWLGFGCLGTALLVSPMLLSLWTRASEDWTFSRARWRFARDSARLSMARDYLGTRRVTGLTREQIETDLGEPLRVHDVWTYAVSSRGLGEPDEQGPPPRYSNEPNLHVLFGEDERVARVLGQMLYRPAAEVAFEPALWDSLAFFRDQRLPLARDLIRSKRLIGADRRAVRVTLGPPDAAELALYYQVAVGGTYEELGLVLWLDEGGRVMRTLIEED